MPTTWFAEAHAATGGRTWVYDLAWISPGLGAGHGLDIPLVFGNHSNGFAARFLGSSPPDGFLPLSDRMRCSWTAFAATGDPGWPCYEPVLRRTRIWDTPIYETDDPLATSRQIWQRHPPR